MKVTTKNSAAIAIAEQDMTQHEFKHGPCIQCRAVGSEESAIWEVEFAYEGNTDRSETTDPPSILLEVNLNTQMVRTIDLM
jgi:hypothetical protein